MYDERPFLKERTSAMLHITPVLNEEDEASGPLGSCARSVAMLPLQPASSRTATPTQHRLEHRFQCIQYNKYLKKNLPLSLVFSMTTTLLVFFFSCPKCLNSPCSKQKARAHANTHTHTFNLLSAFREGRSQCQTGGQERRRRGATASSGRLSLPSAGRDGLP